MRYSVLKPLEIILSNILLAFGNFAMFPPLIRFLLVHLSGAFRRFHTKTTRVQEASFIAMTMAVFATAFLEIGYYVKQYQASSRLSDPGISSKEYAAVEGSMASLSLSISFVELFSWLITIWAWKEGVLTGDVEKRLSCAIIYIGLALYLPKYLNRIIQVTCIMMGFTFTDVSR